MAVSPSLYELALETIRNANLIHPDAPLLESFLEDAVDSNSAAVHMLEKYSGNGDQTSGLTELLRDWKVVICQFADSMKTMPCAQVEDKSTVERVLQRDGRKCCLTGLESDAYDPLIVVPIMPKFQNGVHTSEILRAFLGASLFDCMSKKCAPPEEDEPDAIENYWLVRKSAAHAFAQGYFKISFSKRNKYEVQSNLVGGPDLPSVVKNFEDFRQARFMDHSASDIPTPNQLAIEVLSRLSVPIRWIRISQGISERRKGRNDGQVARQRTWLAYSSLSQLPTAILAASWKQLPSFIRTWAYSLLIPLGRRVFGPSASLNVQQLPFGLYLKTSRRRNFQALENEAAALCLVRDHTELPVPRAIDLVYDSEFAYLLTTRVPGVPLGHCIDIMSDDELDTLAQDLQIHLAAIRAIPRPQHYHTISNATGGACFDYRINAALSSEDMLGSEFIGPFNGESDFNRRLQCLAIPDVIHRMGHDVVFTHGDLNMRNILMDVCGNGDFRLSGVVDWENSGWFPEYWEYTKAHFVTRLSRRWLNVVDSVFRSFGDFQHELEIERELWGYCF